jgi:hypothetical protein
MNLLVYRTNYSERRWRQRLGEVVGEVDEDLREKFGKIDERKFVKPEL